jgi:hypothetical protein
LKVFGFRRIVVIGAVLAVGVGGETLRAQTQLADPRDAPKIFASTCSACHKSPQGLAKSGHVAGFLRQHYTTGPEMSAAMAAYLVAAGNAPAARKGAAADSAAAKSKGRKQEVLSAAQPTIDRSTEAERPRTLRGRQQPKSQDDAPRPSAQPAAPPAAEEPSHQAAAPTVPDAAPSETPTVSVAPQPAAPPLMVLDIALPPMPEAPPPELTQSAFSSSPLP